MTLFREKDFLDFKTKKNCLIKNLLVSAIVLSGSCEANINLDFLCVNQSIDKKSNYNCKFFDDEDDENKIDAIKVLKAKILEDFNFLVVKMPIENINEINCIDKIDRVEISKQLIHFFSQSKSSEKNKIVSFEKLRLNDCGTEKTDLVDFEKSEQIDSSIKKIDLVGFDNEKSKQTNQSSRKYVDFGKVSEKPVQANLTREKSDQIEISFFCGLEKYCILYDNNYETETKVDFCNGEANAVCSLVSHLQLCCPKSIYMFETN